MHPQQWKKKQGRAESLDDLAGGSWVGVARRGAELDEEDSHDVAEEEEVEGHWEAHGQEQDGGEATVVDPASGNE